MSVMVDIKDQIVLQNKWQFDPHYREKVSGRFRDIYYELTDKYLDKDISISVSGLRRVGKTTILYQLINYLLNSGIDNKHILYFQFSEDFIGLEKVLQLYFSDFSEEEISRGIFYVFLDELQYVKNWQNILKSYIDRNSKIKFIVTGSASIYLRDKVKESLAGRILDFTLHPLSFAEMIRLKENFKTEYSFSEIIESNHEKIIEFRKLHSQRLPYKNIFGKYLLSGEFPALLPYLDDWKYCQKYLSDGIIDKILLKDIRLFEVEKQEEISALYRICCSNIAQTINLKNVASETGLAYQTIKKYLSVLKKTYLIGSISNRLRSVRAQIKSLDKIFSLSTNLALITLSIKDPLNPPFLDFRGHIIENFVYNSIRKSDRVYYYNKSGREVDLILDSEDKVVPIEVKSYADLKKTDTNHLLYFMEKNHIHEGYVAYGGNLGMLEINNNKIYLLPYWMF